MGNYTYSRKLGTGTGLIAKMPCIKEPTKQIVRMRGSKAIFSVPQWPSSYKDEKLLRNCWRIFGSILCSANWFQLEFG